MALSSANATGAMARAKRHATKIVASGVRFIEPPFPCVPSGGPFRRFRRLEKEETSGGGKGGRGAGRTGEEPYEEDAARAQGRGEEQAASGWEDLYDTPGGRRRVEVRHRLDAVLEALVCVEVRGGSRGVVGGRGRVRPVIRAGLLGPRRGREENRDHGDAEEAAGETTAHLVTGRDCLTSRRATSRGGASAPSRERCAGARAWSAGPAAS